MPNENAPEFRFRPVEPQKPREKDMKVLCLGLSRTSTMSLYVALKKLGYEPYHMSECSMDWANGSLKNWDEAIEAKYFDKSKKPYRGADFEKMLWKYDAVSDIPCCLFVDELLEAYPDARVVLTTRDVNSWVASIESIVYEVLSWKRLAWLEKFDTAYMGHYMPIVRNSLRVWTDDDPQNREKLREGFAKHNAHVRSVVPKENLLEFHAKDGWEPLCAHLGRPVPNEPFPKVNQGTYVADMHYPLFWFRVSAVVGRWAMYAVPVAAGIWWLRWRK